MTFNHSLPTHALSCRDNWLMAARHSWLRCLLNLPCRFFLPSFIRIRQTRCDVCSPGQSLVLLDCWLVPAASLAFWCLTQIFPSPFHFLPSSVSMSTFLANWTSKKSSNCIMTSVLFFFSATFHFPLLSESLLRVVVLLVS